MVKYKIIYDKNTCIGTLACIEVAKKFFTKADDGKVTLIGSKDLGDGKFELIIDAKDLELAKNSEDVCPVDAIKVEKIEDD